MDSMNGLDTMMFSARGPSTPKRRRVANSPYPPPMSGSAKKAGLGVSTPQRQSVTHSPSSLLAGIGSNLHFSGTVHACTTPFRATVVVFTGSTVSTEMCVWYYVE